MKVEVRQFQPFEKSLRRDRSGVSVCNTLNGRPHGRHHLRFEEFQECAGTADDDTGVRGIALDAQEDDILRLVR